MVELGRPGPEHFDAALASAYAEIAAGWDVPTSSLPDLPGRAVRLLKVRFVRDRSLRVLARDASRVPYRTADDLLRVDGVGVAIVAQMRPFLRFPATAPTPWPTTAASRD